MAFTQQQLNDLEAAIASGARTVSYDGKNVTYGSLEEMMAIRSMIMRSLGLLTASPTVLVAHSRGFSGSSGDDF